MAGPQCGTFLHRLRLICFLLVTSSVTGDRHPVFSGNDRTAQTPALVRVSGVFPPGNGVFIGPFQT
jgi:hypothetical protein